MDVRADSPQTPYEVFCQRCRVTFPLGTRQCIHCNGPIGGKTPMTRQMLRQVATREDAVEATPRKGMFSPMTLIWVLLLVGGALSRTCSSP